VDPGAGGALVISTEVSDRVRVSAARGDRLRITGAGSWLDAGRPVNGTKPLDLSTLSGIVEYVPGDLTLTARAGTPLADIERITNAERQFLALDPFGGGTIGATVATASAGPLAHTFGTPRDAVLGVEAVTGDGELVRGGGRVVKNVAGFDLTRLLTGAWGTLGVITEVSVRLRALPEADETVALSVRDDSEAALRALLARVQGVQAAPWALELLSPALAARLGVAGHPALVARLAGNGDSVRAQRAAFAALGSVLDLPTDVWARLRGCESAGSAVVRLSARRSRVSELWRLARDASADWSGAFAHATVSRGVVRCILPAADAARTRAFLAALRPSGCTIIAERLPAPCWRDAVPAAANDPLSRRARDGFDPKRILNPGILGEES
jgi:glycolate oxidase FAD binding subunit